MANKKINQLDTRVGASLTDLVLIGDPTSGTSYKLTATDFKTLLNSVPYTGATTNVNLGEYGISGGYFQADLTPTLTGGVGRLIWNDTDGTLDLGLKGGNVTLQVGQEQVQRIVNKSGADLLESAYQVVKVTDAQGQRLAVNLAQGNNDANSADTLGIVTETIANNQEGFICTSGIVRGINTTGALQGETWIDGDILYLSPTTPGAITKVKPTAPNHSVILGYVVYAHASNGKIFVKCENGYESSELHDIYTPTKNNNDGIFWVTANNRYESKSIAQVLGFTPVSGNIYTTNGTLSGNRVITMGSNTLTFEKDIIVNDLKIGKGNNSIATNTALGVISLNSITTGIYNLAVGYNAGNSLNSNYNTILGAGAGQSSMGNDNTIVGGLAGQNLTGTRNVFIGQVASRNSNYVVSNVIIGTASSQSSQGSYNVSIGDISNESNTTGSNNVSVGYSVMQQNTTGSNNIAFGYNAGTSITAGGNNAITNNSIYIGHQTRAKASNETNQIVIGYAETGLGSNTTIIGNSSTITTALRGRLLSGTTIDTGLYQLDINGTARVSGALFQTMGTNSVNLLISGATAQTADRGIFIGSGSFNNASVVAIGIGSGANIGTGIGSVAIGFNTNASGGGVAIGSPSGNGATSTGGVAINGPATNGVTIAGSSTTGGVGILGYSTGFNAISIGLASSGSGSFSMALGDRSASAFTAAIAIGLFSTTTASNQLVIGGNDASGLYSIGDVYIGGGVQDLNGNNGTSVTINASGGGNGTNKNGGNITIAGGKGTGTGTPGDVIISTATPTTSGSTLQSLTQRVWIKGDNGNVGIGASPNAAFKLDVTGNTRIGGADGNKLLFFDGGSTNTRHGVGWKNGYGLILYTYGANKIGFVSGDDASSSPTNYYDGQSDIWFLNNITTPSFRLRPTALGKSLHLNSANGQQILFYDGGTTSTRMGIDFIQSVGTMFYSGYSNPILFAINKDNTTTSVSNAEMKLSSSGRLIVGQGTGNESAIVECISTTKGFLPPQMTTTEKNAISSPVAGLIVYDTTTNKLCCYNGTTWNDLF